MIKRRVNTMQKTAFLIPTLIFSLYLTGCAKNNVNDVGYRNQNVNDQADDRHRNATDNARVQYNHPNFNNAELNNPNRGPAMTTVDNSNKNLGNVRNNNDNRSKMRVADKAADKVSHLPEVDTANVIVTENNAFVAAKLDKSSRNELTNDIENKISKAVKSVDPDIDNVYVSTNPDFYDRIKTYAEDIRNGKPVTGFFNQFNDMVRRVFPNMK
jgi:spore cortex protein